MFHPWFFFYFPGSEGIVLSGEVNLFPADFPVTDEVTTAIFDGAF